MTKIKVSYETEEERALMIKCLAKEYKILDISKPYENKASKYKRVHITLRAK